MQSAKEKISNMASAAKEHLTICKAKVEENVDKSTARTHEEKEVAKERRKAKEAQAKMELHQAKAKHVADRLKFHPQHHHPPMVGAQYGPTEPTVWTHPNQPAIGNTPSLAGAAVPNYAHPPGTTYI